MEQFKRAKVVMLPTNEKTKYLMVYSNVEKTKGKLILSGLKNDEYKEYQHLYFLSDDEIKEGDWFLYYNKNNQLEGIARFIKEEGENNTLVEKYSKVTGFSKFYIGILGCKKYKIIATTDIKLGTSEYSDRYRESYFNPLPQPSQQFIQKYIEEYNKGNIITDVLVEYEYLLDDRAVLPYWNLKVNTKDNTITIKKLKEVYTKEELCQVLEKYTSFIWSEVGIHYPISLGIDAKDKFINNEL